MTLAWISTEPNPPKVEGGSGRVAERAGDLSGGTLLDEVGRQGFVLALPWRGGFAEESSRIAYVFWLSDRHTDNLVHKEMKSRHRNTKTSGHVTNTTIFIGRAGDIAAQYQSTPTVLGIQHQACIERISVPD